MAEAQVVDRPAIYPAMCACGSQAGPLVDTMIENHQGRLYVCNRCVAKWAALLGVYRSPEQARSDQDVFRTLSEENDRLAEALAESERSKVVRIDDLATELRKHTPTGSAA